MNLLKLFLIVLALLGGMGCAAINRLLCPEPAQQCTRPANAEPVQPAEATVTAEPTAQALLGKIQKNLDKAERAHPQELRSDYLKEAAQLGNQLVARTDAAAVALRKSRAYQDAYSRYKRLKPATLFVQATEKPAPQTVAAKPVAPAKTAPAAKEAPKTVVAAPAPEPKPMVAPAVPEKKKSLT